MKNAQKLVTSPCSKIWTKISNKVDSVFASEEMVNLDFFANDSPLMDQVMNQQIRIQLWRQVRDQIIKKRQNGNNNSGTNSGETA
jgi:hypothetical protein